MKIKKSTVIYAILLILFFVGLSVRVNMMGMPETHPGNLKAGNAFYHTIAADAVANGDDPFTYPSSLAMGHDNVLNIVSQHQSFLAGSIINLTGIEEWMIIVLIVSLFSALAIPLTYLLVKNVFKSDILALITAALIAVPFNMQHWLYYTYIGIWLQSSAMTLIVASLLLTHMIHKKMRTWKVFMLSIVSTALFLLFPVALLITIPFLIIVFIKLLKTKNMKNILYYVIPPIVGTIVAMPYYYIGYFTNSSYTSAGINSLKEKLATLPFVVSFSGFPWIITALFILGVLLFLGKYKNYKKPLIFLIYYFILLFIGPLVAPSGIATYLLRLWSTLPYIVLPIAAYGMYFIINFVSKTSGFKREYLTLILLIVILIPGLTQANNISEGLKGEHVTKEKYYALQWIQDNTGEEDLIFMLEGSYQGEAVYTKRLTYAVPITELQNQVNSAFTNQEVSFIFEQEWSDVGRWSKWRYKTGYLSYDAYEPLNQTQDIREFDYVFMHHLNEQVKTYNDVMVQVLTENLNWEKVYDTNGFVILKNE